MVIEASVPLRSKAENTFFSLLYGLIIGWLRRKRKGRKAGVRVSVTKSNLPECPPNVEAHRVEPEERGEKEEVHEMGDNDARSSGYVGAR